jgi:hypothetical protein
MQLRYSMPLVKGRGAGLGNEMTVWAKAFIGAQALGLSLLHPAWGLNRRQYWRFFGTSRSDWFFHQALWRALPSFEFKETDLDRTAGESLHDAVLRFAEQHELHHRRAFVLGFGGLWGEYSYINHARPFLRAQLLQTRWAVENLYELERRFDPNKLRIGFHVRRGDFAAPPTDLEYRGRFNTAIPLDWYVRIARRLKEHFGVHASFLIVSDAPDDELGPLVGEFGGISTQDQQNRDVSDLLALSSCDFIVCSVSSYSQWAAFLSESRYGWLEANLTERDGFGSIWGHLQSQLGPNSDLTRSIERNERTIRSGAPLKPRGSAIGWDGVLPNDLLADLADLLALKQSSSDIVLHGAIPVKT